MRDELPDPVRRVRRGPPVAGGCPGNGMRFDPIRAIARDAGSAIMRVYARDFRVRRKADSSPVTDADSMAHRIITGALEAGHPEIPILSEESSKLAPYSERRGWTRHWLVDPLDGTKEFVKRNGQFTVNIAASGRRLPRRGRRLRPGSGTGCTGDRSGTARSSPSGEASLFRFDARWCRTRGLCELSAASPTFLPKPGGISTPFAPATAKSRLSPWAVPSRSASSQTGLRNYTPGLRRPWSGTQQRRTRCWPLPAAGFSTNIPGMIFGTTRRTC